MIFGVGVEGEDEEEGRSFLRLGGEGFFIFDDGTGFDADDGFLSLTTATLALSVPSSTLNRVKSFFLLAAFLRFRLIMLVASDNRVFVSVTPARSKISEMILEVSSPRTSRKSDEAVDNECSFLTERYKIAPTTFIPFVPIIFVS